MQRAMLNGEPIRQGFRPDVSIHVSDETNLEEVTPPLPSKSSQNHATVSVAYRDGAVLTFLFDRSTTIVDLVAMISRAGTVRKVAL